MLAGWRREHVQRGSWGSSGRRRSEGLCSLVTQAQCQRRAVTGWDKGELGSPPRSGSPSWTPGLLPFSPEQGSQVAQAHPGKGGGCLVGTRRDVGKQQANGKRQFHHPITQQVCDSQVPLFVSSRSMTGHQKFPKWAALEVVVHILFPQASHSGAAQSSWSPSEGEGDPRWGKRHGTSQRPQLGYVPPL